MSPGGQTPLLSWCLFSAAYVDSPAEEEGKRSNKRAERKKGRELEGGKHTKNKADRENEQKRKVCDEQEKQELLAKRKDGIPCLCDTALTGLLLSQ